MQTRYTVLFLDADPSARDPRVLLAARRSAYAAKAIKTLLAASGAQRVKYVGQTGEIAAFAQAQAASLAEVNTAVTQMDQMAPQNAAIVEESTTASQAKQRNWPG